MLVLGRWCYHGLNGNSYLPSSGLYENLIGVVREKGTGPQASAQSVRVILENACTVRKGRRNGGSLTDGAQDYLDKELLEHVQALLFRFSTGQDVID